MDSIDVGSLLDKARSGGAEPLGNLLQLYRNYMTLLASTQIGGRLGVRVSPSDIVQETMLAAYRDFEKFRGTTEREFLAWLRQTLIHTIHHAVEIHIKAMRRDVRREVSLNQLQVGTQLDQSACELIQTIADPGTSPSTRFHQNEATLILAERLSQLRPQYRDVIVLRNLQGLPFEAVAQRMGRTPSAARMLWLRAMEQLKSLYRPNSESA